jgi:hypothetical protein
MNLATHLLNAERAYWQSLLSSGLSMQQIAKTSGLSYRQMYYHLGKVGVRAGRRDTAKVRAMRGRLLSPEDSIVLASLSPKAREAAIGMIVNDLRA